MKRILILAGAAVLLVLTVVLVLRDRGEGGARSALVDTPAAAPTPAATAPRTEARRTPPTVEASGASTTASPSVSPDARVAPATADAPTVPLAGAGPVGTNPARLRHGRDSGGLHVAEGVLQGNGDPEGNGRM